MDGGARRSVRRWDGLVLVDEVLKSWGKSTEGMVDFGAISPESVFIRNVALKGLK